MDNDRKTVCQENLCTGCNACLNVCKTDALNKIDNGMALNVRIDTEKCINCGACRKVCPIISGCTFREPLMWIQGISRNPRARKMSTSGAFAYEISKAFVESGGYVAGCCFNEGEFMFRLVKDVSELKQFCGSKYVKSDTKKLYSEIRELLKKGEKVLFTGLPCQSAGLQHFVGKLSEKLYTLDLICHGTPSVKVLDIYLEKQGIDRRKAAEISFRNGHFYELSVDGRRFDKSRSEDMLVNTSDDFSDAFLKRMNHLEGCYSCLFKRPQRVSDISVGDAWGTEHSDEELCKGISLALPTTEKGKELLRMADISTEPIDRDAVLRTNDQLEYPWPKPEHRDEFLSQFISN